jgi:hypothetical protein
MGSEEMGTSRFCFLGDEELGMTTTAPQSRVDELVKEVKEAEERLAAAAKVIDRFRKSLRKSRDQLTRSAWPLKAVSLLQVILKDSPEIPFDVGLTKLADCAGSVMDQLQRAFVQNFRKELVAEAAKVDLAFGTIGDELTIGPFNLVLDREGERATLRYAKSPFGTDLPLDAAKIVTVAKELAAELLARPEDTGRLRDEFEEAVLVVLVRERKSTRLGELRAPLPAVFRELTFLRQSGKHSAAQKSRHEYTLARFAVEVASLVRSEVNLSSEKPFRLETSVIENTGNPRKSVFIPKDLTKGYGEGMYYQAIVLRQTM